MKNNVVLADRTVRIGAGLLLLASPLLEMHTYPFNLLGLIPLVTGLAGYCPLYAAFSALRPKEHGGQRDDEHRHGSATRA